MIQLQKPFLIGMIHLPPSPGYPKHPGMKVMISKALRDLHTLEQAGFDAVLVENDNDQPHQIKVSSHIKEAFAKIMQEVIKEANIPVGMEIIYDMTATYEVASVVGAEFVRLDVFVDKVSTKWGVIEASAIKVLALKKKFGTKAPLLLTDVHVKHATMLETKSLEESVKEALRYESNGIIVTGDWTGLAPDIFDCKKVFSVVKQAVPVIVGSGLTEQNAASLFQFADGAIVGTSIKTDAYIDLMKATTLAKLTHSFKGDI